MGSGIGRSMAEMIGLVEEVTGRPVPIRHLAARPIDVAAIVLDCSRIRRDLNWAARPIEATIADVWQSMGHDAQQAIFRPCRSSMVSTKVRRARAASRACRCRARRCRAQRSRRAAAPLR